LLLGTFGLEFHTSSDIGEKGILPYFFAFYIVRYTFCSASLFENCESDEIPSFRAVFVRFRRLVVHLSRQLGQHTSSHDTASLSPL